MLFVVFVIAPLVYGLWISLHNYDYSLPDKPFVGLDNYTGLIDGSSPQADPFWDSMKATGIFAVFSVPLLLVQGLPQQEIAKRLSLSPKTVNTHKSRMFEKLGLSISDTVGLARLVGQYGLADPATTI